MIFYAYMYNDPKSNIPVYIGKGSGNRAYAHTKASTNPKLNNLIKKRLREGYIIEPMILICESEQEAFELEKQGILYFGREDLGTGTLFNCTDGGEGGCYNPSQERRLQMSAVNKGKVRSEETRKLLSIAKKGVPKSKEHRLKLSASMKGKNTGKLWWNNGVTNIKAYECPLGFVPGMLKKKKKKERVSSSTPESWIKQSNARKGMLWFNNGTTVIRARECPAGFVPGRLR